LPRPASRFSEPQSVSRHLFTTMPPQPHSLSRRSLLASLLSAPVLAPFARAQFSTSVKVINVFATVRDKDGKIVKGLTKEDFTLSEDGRPQKIQYFTQSSDLPLTLGLLIDTSGSERRNIATERDASYKFLESVLRPEKDKAFVIHFDREVELLQDLTASRERLEKALDLLQASNPQQNVGNGNDPNNNGGNGGGNGGNGGNGGTWGGGGGGGIGGGGMGWPGGRGGMGGGRRGGSGRQSGYRGGGTKFFDAVYLAADEILAKQQGRKAVIMLTDGEDNGSRESVDTAIHSAQKAEMLGYSIHIADSSSGFTRGFGSGGYGGGNRGGGEHVDGKKVLKQISKATGGGYFEFKKSLDDIYSQINEELRNQYSIGYTSDKPEADGSFRKIELTARGKDLTVQSRDGYYATSADSPAAPAATKDS
jgi:VWFA-related protein